jgi:hypothetical protein
MKEENSFKITKNDMELISLGLNEYINHLDFSKNQTNEEISEIRNMIERLKDHLKEF